MADLNKKRQLVVIGGGPGGYAAAFLAADLGMQVTLIDTRINPGGVCLYVGCIPSKALLHLAKVINEAKEAENWGVTFSKPKIDIDKIRAWKESVVTTMTGGLGQLSKRRNIDYIHGKAFFENADTLTVTLDNGKTEIVTFEHAIIATGSKPVKIPSLSLDSPRVLDSTTALDLENIPKSMLIVGGGYIGLEIGTVYAALGSTVSVVEMTSGLLPGADRDLVAVLRKRVARTFDTVMLNTMVKDIKEQKNGIKVFFDGADVEKKERVYEKILVSVGRRPVSGGFGLENTKVEIDEKGFIKVDAQRRTHQPAIYAIGDVAGEPMLAHKASHEGRLAAEAIAGHKVAYGPHAIPAVVFTDPEIAWCGLTESEAKKQERAVNVAKFPWGASGRATAMGIREGLTKLVIDPKTQRILGVGIAGSGAGELIAEGVLAVEMAALASDIELSIHPHPTLSETIMEAASVFFGTSTHIYRPKRQ
jgi:dihydrolipoamide dehydrogenase